VLKLTPLGRAPVSVNVGVGKPVAVSVNYPGVPTTNVVLLALVIVGAWFTMWDTPTDVLVAKFASPVAKVATSVFAPVVVGVN
jgi:hypothetical protein